MPHRMPDRMPERIPYIIPDHARYSVRIFQRYIYIYNICVIPTMFCHGGDHSNLFFSVRVMRNTQRTVKSQERAQNFEQKMGTDHGPNLNLASMYHGQWPIQTDVLLILTSEMVTMTRLKSKSHPTEKQPWMNSNPSAHGSTSTIHSYATISSSSHAGVTSIENILWK